MDPHVSRLVRPVTEYSATQGSSGFHEQYWPGMYTARLLLPLKQGKRSLEDFIQEYLDVANYSDFPDDVLINFFCDGINQPLKSKLICEGPRSSLSQFLDYALLCVGSSFTVGVAEEERDTALNCVIAATPEHTYKMVAIAEPVHKMAATTTTPCHVIAASHESSQVTVDLRESSQITVDRHESSQITVDPHESLHVSALQPESLHVSALQPESLHVSALQPESLHVSALQPESLHVSALQPDSLHISALQPESLHVAALQPESLHVAALQPESLHVSAELPESITPRDLRSVLRVPCLVSSVRDAPLVSARAAGICTRSWYPQIHSL